MRFYTIEKIISLDDIFSLIKNIIKSSFKIDENSYTDDHNLLIIGINENNQSVIIRGFIDKSKNRTYFSISALHSNQIPEDLKSLNNTIKFRKSIGKILFNVVKNSKENARNYAFANLRIKKPEERKFKDQLIETEKEILMKLIDLLRERFNYDDVLRKYPFSLIDIDGSWEIWYDIYDKYIDLIENNFITSKKTSPKTFRNYDFALDNAYSQRIADLIMYEVEQNSNPAYKSSGRNFKKVHNNFQTQALDEEEKNSCNLKITFIFTHKKRSQLRLIQMLKLLEEVKIFTQLLHEKVFRHYDNIYPQLIFISLFGFEQRVGNYLKDNLYGILSRNISVLAVPPIDNKLWHNYFVNNSLEENEYTKSQSLIYLKTYNNLKRSGGVKQSEVRKMESKFQEILETKRVSAENSQEINDWIDILSINDYPKLMDIKNSRERIQKATN